MKRYFRRTLSVILSLSLAASLALPAMASYALGEDLSASDTQIHEETTLSTNVFWSTSYSDLRTENVITYSPNREVTPIVTYGSVLTACKSVASMARELESRGYRVVAGINGDFYNVGTGLPIGIVVTDGVLRSSDGGYHAVGFRADGSAIIGKPGVKVTADMGYSADDGLGNTTEYIRNIAAVNKARVSTGGIYLYTYDFNDRHTTGTTETGVNVLCTLDGELAIGSEVTARVEAVEESTVMSIGEGQIVLSANSQSNSYFTDVLRNVPVGAEITLTVSANDGWEDAEYAVGALYPLLEDGVVASGLEAGANPRTAIGQKADGTVVLYTIDGRKSGYSIGATLTQVAERLAELGCVNAVCLDGGGSTNLAVTTPDSVTATIANTPSETGRAVTNQIFLVADNTPSGRLDHFYVESDADFVLAGSSVTISASAVDTNYIPMAADFDLTASDGSLSGNVLTTPNTTGIVTVTASNGSKRGSTDIHVIETPDSIAVYDAGTAVSALTVTPGSTTALSARASSNHLPLKADAANFTWSFNGNCGTVDGSGVFRASAPGSGTLTVSAGSRSVQIPVVVNKIALKTLEDFESGTGSFYPDGSAGLSRCTVAETVKYGKGCMKLDYRLAGDLAGVQMAYSVPSAYDSVNLWVYGDNSGNRLYLTTADGAYLNVCTLSFTGWRQCSVALPEGAGMLTGLSVQGESRSVVNEETGEVTVIRQTPAEGTIYLDQMVASFDGTTDETVPVISAVYDAESHRVTASVSDVVDGILAANAVTCTLNGRKVTAEYNAQNGNLLYLLPTDSESYEAMRFTVTAKDASGNIGRASVDVEPVGVGHKFSDVDGYWAATYVDFLYNAGITTGYSDGSFRPDQNITRAQFAVMLFRYLGLDETKYANVSLPFADLKKIGDYALPAIRALYAEGIINGSTKNGKTYFDPDSALTRAQAATMIGRTQARGYALAALGFTDSGKIPAYATYYIQTMVAQGVISGYADGSFKPANNITRGQMAKILYNLM